LVFVVAVSIAAAALHHELSEGHIVEGIRSDATVFIGIGWAWMNFTWFATSFDTDDWLYRVLSIVQMAGVLVLAAGIDPAFFDHDFALLVYGYVIMRIAMVLQWLRASREAGERRRTTQLYAIGIAGVQLLWLLWLSAPAWLEPVGLVLLIAVEVAIPVIAERHGTTAWHPHQITERYGLFTLILLGESLLASANATIGALHSEAGPASLVRLAILSLIVTAALWWIYFWPPHHRAIQGLGSSLLYGYSHYFVFAAAGALSAGIEVEIDVLTEHSELSQIAASVTVTVPIAIFMLGVWLIAVRMVADRIVNVVVPVAALLVLFDPLIPCP
jgi:low temperature requirement protein LtrA